MKPKQFIDEIVPKMNVEKADLTKTDRYLANAGFRKKADGRNYPDMTTKEAIRLPLAIAVARTPARAVEDIRSVEQFSLIAGDVTLHEGSTEALPALLGMTLDEIKKTTLMNVLDRIAKHVAAPWKSELCSDVWIKVELGGPVTLQIEGDGFKGELVFIGAMSTGDWTFEFTRTATIGPKLLAWIGHVTKDVD